MWIKTFCKSYENSGNHSISAVFWSALTKKMQEQSLVPQWFAGFLGSIFRFAIRTPSIL